MAGPVDTVLRRPGRLVLRQYHELIESAVLLAGILRGARGLARPSNRKVLFRQIYFTAVQPLNIVVAGAFIIGAVFVYFTFKSLSSVGLMDKVGGVSLLLIVGELSSLFIAIVIMLRSGSAIIAELALMKLMKETDALRSLNIGVFEYLLTPRFLTIVFANIILSVLFSVVALLGGYLAYGFFNGIPFYDYVDIMAGAATIADFVTIYVKSTVFGAIIAVHSIKHGLNVRASITEVPVRLIAGLTRQMIVIVVFDILYDSVRYAILFSK